MALLVPSHYQVYNNSTDVTRTFLKRRKPNDSADDDNKEKLKKSEKIKGCAF